MKGEKSMTTTEKNSGENVSLNFVKDIISSTLGDFLQQEAGNRVTRFNIQGLAQIILEAIKSHKGVKK
jgi:hypothetical protein